MAQTDLQKSSNINWAQMKVFEFDGSPVHLVGIGGSGMSGIARILLSRGIRVSGSDLKESQETRSLRVLGCQIAIGHETSNIYMCGEPPGAIIVSTAVNSSNMELIEASRLGIPIIHRSQALAALMKHRIGIAISGTHGKTTTTSMMAITLQGLGADPSYSIGSGLGASGSNAHDGKGEYFVIEADESDRSFLAYDPNFLIITNIEIDHVDQFNSIDEIDRLFEEFAKKTSNLNVVCGDDPGVQRLLKTGLSAETYGMGLQNNLVISEINPLRDGIGFNVSIDGRRYGDFRLKVPGAHNALNAGAVILTAHRLGFSIPDIKHALEQFRGARRRFDIRGERNSVRVIDDYAHHPTEISATLAAARGFAPKAKVIVIFQPHRYTRLEAFLSEFAAELSKADAVAVMEVYAAGEQPIPAVSGKRLAELIPNAKFLPSFLDVSEWASTVAEPGDLILTMGAGDVTLLAPAILEALSDR